MVKLHGAGPTLRQHWFNVSCLLGCAAKATDNNCSLSRYYLLTLHASTGAVQNQNAETIRFPVTTSFSLQGCTGVLLSQKAITAYFPSEQLLLFDFCTPVQVPCKAKGR